MTSASEFFRAQHRETNPHRRGYNKELADKINSNSNQFPTRMYRPKYQKDKPIVPPSPDRIHPDIPTEEEIDELLLPAAERIRRRKEKQEQKDRSHLQGLELVYRHRYGDDIDILRATFTKTKEEIEQEKFILIQACRTLTRRVHWSLTKVPKHEKYVLGGDIRSIAYSVLRHSIAIKKRYYRKNLLEHIDVELDVLRELYLVAYTYYPTWVDDAHFHLVIEDINEVGRLVGGLLKTTVV